MTASAAHRLIVITRVDAHRAFLGGDRHLQASSQASFRLLRRDCAACVDACVPSLLPLLLACPGTHQHRARYPSPPFRSSMRPSGKPPAFPSFFQCLSFSPSSFFLSRAAVPHSIHTFGQNLPLPLPLSTKATKGCCSLYEPFYSTSPCRSRHHHVVRGVFQFIFLTNPFASIPGRHWPSAYYGAHSWVDLSLQLTSGSNREPCPSHTSDEHHISLLAFPSHSHNRRRVIISSSLVS